MPLSADLSPVELWQLPHNAQGPFHVDSWDTSYTDRTGNKKKAYRVVGTSGGQLYIPAQDGAWRMASGAVIMETQEYAQLVCDAANSGVLTRQQYGGA